MSLINTMLQDLDARGGQPGLTAVSPEIKPVLPPERGFPWLRVVLIACLAAMVGASAYVAWRVKNTTAVEVPVLVTGAPQAAADPESPPAAPPSRAQPAAEPAPAAAAPARLETAAPAPDAKSFVAPQTEKIERTLRQEEPVRKREAASSGSAEVRAPARTVQKPAASPATRPATTAPRDAKPSAGRVETAAQQAENGYRRALASLEDGRVTEAIAQLQGALRADPGHEAARQTLVSLLVEARRPDEAMRQLQAGLTLDPRQPAMAMLLARLQIEAGVPAIDTLLRTLPYAAGNGDYHAFLAGALAREQRHREAAEHYTAALRSAPQNGVWWMGLGLSLQAEKRDGEAADAYQKARASGTLSAELRGFVERKLKQLAP